MRLIGALTALLIITADNYATLVDGDPIGTGGPSVVTEGKDALLTCVIMGPFENDTVIWRKDTEILAAGMNRVTADKRLSVLHDDGECGRHGAGLEGNRGLRVTNNHNHTFDFLFL